MKKKQTSVRLPRELRDALQQLADRDKRSLSNMVIFALDRYVNSQVIERGRPLGTKVHKRPDVSSIDGPST